MKRPFSLLFTLCVLTVSAAMAQTSGNCGTNLTWRLNNGSLVISGSGAMEDYDYASKAPWFSLASQISKVYISEGVTYVGKKAFGSNVYSLTMVEFGLDVERIHQEAFGGIAKLDEVVWGTNAYEDINSYDEGPFWNCDNVIKTFTVLEEVTYLPNYLCYGLYNMTTLTLGNFVARIGEGCFGNCSRLTSVTLPDDLWRLWSLTFYGCRSLRSVDLRNVMEINGYAFEDCEKLDNITFPASIKMISAYAFEGCTSLHNIVWEVDDYVTPAVATSGPFDQIARQITSFKFSDNVTKIPPYLCEKMTCFSDLTLPSGVTEIGRYAFSKCSTIRSLTLPSSLQMIETGGFSSCTSLRKITSLACTPPVLQSGVFEDCLPHLSDITLDVPDGCESAYRTAEGWKEFSLANEQSIEEVPSDQVPCTKLLRDGQLIIIRNGVEYNAAGQIVK